MAEEGIAAGGVMDTNTALQEVLKTALIHDGLARGIHEAAKALDKCQAHLCVLASNCNEPMYVKLVETLCAEHQINLIKVNDNKKLGEWVGLCKRKGKPCKLVGCSCVVVKDYGKESQAKYVIGDTFGIKDPPVLKTDTQEAEKERQKILTRQFLFIRRVQACVHSS
jgi:small subunit ribosomal protein S12e